MNTDVKAELAPTSPKTHSIGGWLKNNLFNTWYNSILTLLCLMVIYYVATGVTTWLLTGAEWAIVTDNFKLFMVGQYPIEQLYRIWLCLLFVAILFGVSAGIWKGTFLHLASVLTLIMFLHTLAPFISGTSKLWLAGSIAALVVGYFVGQKLPKPKMITLIGWFISFPIIIFLVNGFSLLPKVATNVWGGLLLTLVLSIVAIVGSVPIGILLALGRTSKLPLIKGFCVIYIETIRGVPLITIFFMSIFMFPLFLPEGISINNVISAMIGATLFTAAYMAENVRGGLQSIPNGQREAAKALGLNPIKSMFFIIMPQALRAVIPAIVGQSISMFKDTSLVTIVGLMDLLGIAQSVKSNPDYLGSIMEVYLFVAIVYWVIAFSMSYSSRRLEKSLGVGER
ncbi:amino acid ABC transporter permease [Gracilibacillus salinarum]|uniref:Amino acid ABC transporter permease n=1 Tax=Gracilibacillus salinarum TaxID=2932255 RepID=A0ABY4GV65_9BACI|nr:amino acid ABC transporter permease [Gracilibacillus salinarum]UOQ87527.1 amino acid ABC transporter permease [Gracilibacillus salinarum]